MFQPKPYGRYYLLSRLAMGGMAEVFIATDRTPKWPIRLVAIKRILGHLAEQDEFLKMFLDEARIAATLHHENILRVTDVGHADEDDTFFLALPYVEGTEIGLLAEAAQRSGSPLTAREAAWAMARVLRALQYAHVRTDSEGHPLGIVHRDVSPPNILVSMEGEPLLTDFGIVQATQKLAITNAGVIKTKLGYTSPEVISGIPADTRHDVFCAGLTLWELLAGRPPFLGDSDAALAEAVRKAAIPPPSTLRPGLSPELDAIVMRSLRPNREQRYPSAHDFAEALDNWLRANGGDPPQKLISERMARLYGLEMRRRRERVERLLEKAGLQEEVSISEDEPLTDADLVLETAARSKAPGAEEITGPHEVAPEAAPEQAGNGLYLPSRGEGLSLIDPPSPKDSRLAGTLRWAMLGLVAVIALGAVGAGVSAYLSSRALAQVPLPTPLAKEPDAPSEPLWKPGPAWQKPAPADPPAKRRRRDARTQPEALDPQPQTAPPAEPEAPAGDGESDTF